MQISALEHHPEKLKVLSLEHVTGSGHSVGIASQTLFS